MPINEKFLQARAKERRFRLMAHVRALCWIRLHNSAGVFAHSPLQPLTERHRLELILIRCAFFTGAVPSEEDVKLFLWRLHPLYAAPRFGRERWAGKRRFKRLCLAYAFGSLRSANAYIRLCSAVRRCDVGRAAAAIDAFLLQSDQDAPGFAVDGKTRGISAPDRCAVDNFVEFAMRHYGLTPDQALDLPVALFNQLYREQVLTTPDGDFAVFAPSDNLL